MSIASSTLNCYNRDTKLSLHRHTADFHPDIWRDYFIQYASESTELDHKTVPQVEAMKKEVSKILVSKAEKPLAKVDMIDSICRLGVNYHFEREIEEVLQQIHKNYVENGEINLEENLRSHAVLFRLLRQHGFRVSPDIFNKFKDVQGNFSEKLTTDIEGMLSLYEASHVRVHGEDILDEALAFTSTHLESIVTQLSPSLATSVNHSLKQALHKNLPRLEARRYIPIYQQDPSHNEILLTLAILDFNILQNLHQREFGYICKWWKEFDVPRNLPYVRDRVVECCFWILAVYYEPQYSQARKIMMKVIALLTIIDDTYDAYGTIDELELLTEAIERWDISCLDDGLPECIKLSYRSLLKFFEEIEQEMRTEGRAYSVEYTIKELKKAVQAYMTEARWLNSNYVPTTEEYTRISTMSTCYLLLTTTSYIGMGDIATEDIFKWVTNQPKIVYASCLLCRLMDDIVSNKFEQKRGHVSSFLECYMREYGESREAAIEDCRKRVTNAWKDINEECLRPTKVPMPFLTRVLNLSRFMDVIYKDEDNFTHAGGVMKTYIKALLVDPVPI
ncbi:probable terpene synthase 2 [Gastrolobium bilobum]|uniref:probable terpene synthase 2 n=1 Tax=Gastrolobium bilobum TaxID=150636 RepID=UPI002AB13C9F|nr:probable terpene synthase 2 [Gastrolobium bilobum]